MNVIKSFTLGAMIFPSFDFFNSKFDNIYIASILTTIGTSCVVYPIEYMKIKKMVTGEKYGSDSQKSLRVITGQLSTWNIKKYYSGFCVHIARCIPNFLIFNAVTEKMKIYLFS